VKKQTDVGCVLVAGAKDAGVVAAAAAAVRAAVTGPEHAAAAAELTAVVLTADSQVAGSLRLPPL